MSNIGCAYTSLSVWQFFLPLTVVSFNRFLPHRPLSRAHFCYRVSQRVEQCLGLYFDLSSHNSGSVSCVVSTSASVSRSRSVPLIVVAYTSASVSARALICASVITMVSVFLEGSGSTSGSVSSRASTSVLATTLPSVSPSVSVITSACVSQLADRYFGHHIALGLHLQNNVSQRINQCLSFKFVQ